MEAREMHETDAASLAARITIGDMEPCHDEARSYIVLDPGDPDDPERAPHVYLWSVIGGGMSPDIWHQRHLSLDDVPADVVARDLEEWLGEDEQRAKLAELASRYLGSEWDGSNYVGQWAFPDDDDPPPRELGLFEAMQYGERVRRTWDASEYFVDGLDTDEHTECLCGDLTAMANRLDDDTDFEVVLRKTREWLESTREELAETYAELLPRLFLGSDS